MTRPAVLFGGPSPEHDISVLTGLQAVTALAKDGVEVTAIYWARSGDFFEVDSSLAPTAFVEGVPRGAHRLDLVARPGGGFVPEAGGGIQAQGIASLTLNGVTYANASTDIGFSGRARRRKVGNESPGARRLFIEGPALHGRPRIGHACAEISFTNVA